MGIIKTIGRMLGRARGGTEEFLRRTVDRRSDGRIYVTEDNAVKFSAVYSAVNRISSDIAKLPLKLMAQQGGRRDVARGHRIHDILSARPNDEQTSFIFRQGIMWDTLLSGNGYAEIQRDHGGEVVALLPIQRGTITPIRDAEGRLRYHHVRDRGRGIVIFDPEDVLHIRTPGSGIEGLSPIQLFRTGIGLALAAEEAGESFFSSGMRPGGVLSHPGQLSDQAIRRLREQVEGQVGGAANQGRLLVLEEGLKYLQMSIPPQDAQYIETRVHQVREIARIYQIPPHKLADMADATFSNVEEQNSEYVDDCLAPWIVQWEQEISAKLLAGEERRILYPHFQVDAILRGNSQSRSEFYSKMFNIGAFSINEIRAKEDMDGIGEEGDSHMVPVNLQKAGSIPEAAREAALAVVREAAERLDRQARSGDAPSGDRRRLLLGGAVRCYAAIVGRDADELLDKVLNERDADGIIHALSEIIA